MKRWIAVIVIAIAAFVALCALTVSVLRGLSFDATERVDESAAAAALPQNAWLVAQRRVSRALSSLDYPAVLWADVARRDGDGLIVVRPIGWYVYYVRGGDFFYLTPSFSNGRVCPAGWCAAVILRPIRLSSDDNGGGGGGGGGPTPETSCLNCTRLELLEAFAHESSCRRRIDLDALLSTTDDGTAVMTAATAAVTITTILNHLMDLRVL